MQMKTLFGFRVGTYIHVRLFISLGACELTLPWCKVTPTRPDERTDHEILVRTWVHEETNVIYGLFEHTGEQDYDR